MKPRITFLYNKKTSSLDVRIKMNTIPAGVYRTGISVNPELFDQDKQICGDTAIQAYMNITVTKLATMYRPGMLPEQLWTSYLSAANGTTQTIEDAFNYYLESKKVEPSTRRNLENTKTKVAEAGLLTATLATLNAAMVRKFVSTLSGEASTIYLAYSQLKTVVKLFVKDHNLKDVANIDGILKAPPTSNGENEEAEYLSFEEVKALMALPIEDKKLNYGRDMFLVMCFTGMAIGDLVNFTTDWLMDDKWLIYQRGKTRKTKRKCKVPILPITRELIYKHTWPTKAAKRTIQYYCERLSKLINKPITPHTARHSFGVIMLYFGFSMESVREMMGHKSIHTTEQIYAKVSKEKIENEMKNIPKIMNEAFEV